MQESTYQICPQMSKGIFRAYDIRGVVADALSADAVYTIGLSLGSFAQDQGEKTMYVARDGRTTGPELAKALAAGLLASGCDVIDIGCVPSPILYLATKCGQSKSGVMLTASHNPPEYNGMKMVVAGKTLAELEIQSLYERIQACSFHHGQGEYQQKDFTEFYYQECLANVDIKRPLKVVVDCGNGVAGPFILNLLEKLNCEIIPLYCDIDGSFPNHQPDPSEAENMQDLIAAVRENNAEVGLAFDGDGDRLGIVTNKGDIIWADRLIMLFVKHLLQENPGAEIIYDVKCSRHLANVIKENGGVPLMWRTGHSLIKAKMHERQAKFAGEMSGHIFFADRWYGFDDGIYSALRLLEILSKDARSCHDIFVEDIPDSVNTPEIKIAIAEELKFSFMQNFLQQAEFNNAELITIDGLRADFPYGWGLVRASNTSAYLVARFEANNTDDLAKIQGVFRQQLLQVDAELELPF